MRTLPIRTALISVHDKTGIVEFARALVERGVRIYSTGGTAKVLSAAGIAVTPVEDVTGQAEILGGRVKTLHPVIHGGILARRNVPGDMDLLARDAIAPIDMVVVNLYPFEATIEADPDNLDHAVENIDIGGPTMIRAAAKNHRDVAVVTDPADYEMLLAELAAHDGISAATAAKLAVKAYQTTAAYDAVIQNFFAEAYGAERMAPRYAIGGSRVQTLRYGENPHQAAAFYRYGRAWGLTAAEVLQGKELSYNNLLDLDGALRCILEFTEPAAVIIKHTNPCGVAIGDTLHQAYLTARDVDPVSAFGSVIALNRVVDEATAMALAETFIEAVIAPGYDAAALALLAKKKNVRLLKLEPWPAAMRDQLEVRTVAGGLLVQNTDSGGVPESEWRVVTVRAPSETEFKALRFAWKVAKHVKSNAIVFAEAHRALGIGAGQMSRIDSTEIAVKKARFDLSGCAVASDAFFPFRDGIDALAAAGAKAVIQPGGSIRDDEVIAAANEHGIAMVFTSTRHFKH